MQKNREERQYQETLIGNVLDAFRTGQRKVLLAACVNAGKTDMSLEVAERLLTAGDVQRVLVLAHNRTDLRQQYQDELAKRPHLIPLIDVRIPAELNRKEVGQYDLVTVDEAHQFYGKGEQGTDEDEDPKMVRYILAHAKPKYQLLLTGTPASFIAQDEFKVGTNAFCYSLQQLYRDRPEACATVIVENAVSNYDWTQADLNDKGDLRLGTISTQRQTNATIASVLQVLKARLDISDETLDGFFSGLTRWRFWSLKKRWNAVLTRLKKTIIATPSIEVAEQVGAYFQKNGINCIVSHSENDSKSQGIGTFKKKDSVRLLVVVDRGRLGFNFSELFHYVDMTGTKNPDTEIQMIGRIVRASLEDPTRQKLFVKVMSRAFSQDDTCAFMSGVLSLAQQENYEKWNGKNFNGTLILTRSERDKKEPRCPSKHELGVKCDDCGWTKRNQHQRKPFWQSGMTVESYFKALEHNPDDALAVYAMARLGDVVGVQVRDRDGTQTSIVEFIKRNGRPLQTSKDDEERRLAVALSKFISTDPAFEARMRALGILSQSEQAEAQMAFHFEWLDTHDGFGPSQGSTSQTLHNGHPERWWGQNLNNLKRRWPDFKKRHEAKAKKGFFNPKNISAAKRRYSKAVVDVCCGNVYPSAQEAARVLGIYQSAITNCCNGKYKNKTANGHTFRHATPEESVQ